MGLSAALNTVTFEAHLRCQGCQEEIVDAVELPLAQRSLPAARDALSAARWPRCPHCHSANVRFEEAYYRWDEQDLAALRLDAEGVWRCAGRVIEDETALRAVIGRPFAPLLYRQLMAVEGREDLADVIPGLAFDDPCNHRFKRLRCGVWADMSRFGRALDRQARRFDLDAVVAEQISVSLRGLALTMPDGWLSDAVGVHGLTLEEAASAFAIAAARRLWMIDGARPALNPSRQISATLNLGADGRSWPLLDLLSATSENESELERIVSGAGTGGAWPCGCQPTVTWRLEWRDGQLHRRAVSRCRHWHQPSAETCVPELVSWPHHVRCRTAAPGDEGVVLAWGTDAASVICWPALLRGLDGVDQLTPGRGGKLLAYPYRRDLVAVASPQTPHGLVALACAALRREAGADHGWMGEQMGGAVPLSAHEPASYALTMIRI